MQGGRVCTCTIEERQWLACGWNARGGSTGPLRRHQRQARRRWGLAEPDIHGASAPEDFCGTQTSRTTSPPRGAALHLPESCSQLPLCFLCVPFVCSHWLSQDFIPRTRLRTSSFHLILAFPGLGRGRHLKYESDE